jgi:integrase
VVPDRCILADESRRPVAYLRIPADRLRSSAGYLRISGDRPPLHSYVEAGTDIWTIQTLLGHKDVRTTMIYTHIVDRGTLGAISPLDR